MGLGFNLIHLLLLLGLVDGDLGGWSGNSQVFKEGEGEAQFIFMQSGLSV